VRQRYPSLPILLTSGYADVIRHEAQADRFNVLTKPYDIDELANALRAQDKSGDRLVAPKVVEVAY
jgi:DNA-binding NtrC family response regulator